MRLDPEHIRTLRHAIEVDDDGEADLKISIGMMRAAQDHLSTWEVGLLSVCLAKAAAKAAAGGRLRPEQRVILALFAHKEPGTC